MNGGRDSIGVDEIRVEFERLFLFLLLVGKKGGSIRHDGVCVCADVLVSVCSIDTTASAPVAMSDSVIVAIVELQLFASGCWLCVQRYCTMQYVRCRTNQSQRYAAKETHDLMNHVVSRVTCETKEIGWP